jgi:hypothetical protein
METVNITILEVTDMLCNYNTEKPLGLEKVFIELPKKPHVFPCRGHTKSSQHCIAGFFSAA